MERPSEPPIESASAFSTWGLVGMAVLVSVLPSFVAVVVLNGGYERYPDVRSLVVDFVVPQGIVVVVLALIISQRRAWTGVLRDSRPVRAWVWAVPALVVATALAVMDFQRLVDAGATSFVAFTGILLLAANEEIVFRGALLDEMRRRTTEQRAAWTSSIAFGLLHFLGGPIQVVVSVIFGHLLYYTRRASGGLVAPVLVHTAWNFSVLSAYLSENPAERATASVSLTLVSTALLIVLGIFHRRLEPSRSRAPT